MKSNPLAAVKKAADWSLVSLADGGFAPHAESWDALSSRLRGNHPLRSASMLGQLLCTSGRGNEQLCIGRDSGGTAVAMLVLQPRSRRVWQSFCPTPVPIGAVLIPHDMSTESIWQALPDSVLQLDLLRIDERQIGLVTAQSGRPNCSWQGLAMQVDLQLGFDAYWRGRSDELRLGIEAAERKLVAEGGVRFDCVQTSEAIARADPADGSPLWTLHRALLAGCGDPGSARLHRLWVGARLAGSCLLLIDGQSIVAWLTFDAARPADAAQGGVLIRHVLRACFAGHPGKRVELCGLDPRALQPWATARSRLFRISMHRNPDAAPFQFGLALQALQPAHASARASAKGLQTEMWAPERAPADVLALLAAAESHNVQYGADWLLNLCRNVRIPDRTAWLHVLRRDAAVVAVLPLFVGDSRWPTGRRIDAMANYYSACYAPALADGVVAAELAPLLADVLARHPGSASLRLAPMDTLSREFSVLREALALAGLVAYPFFCFGNWYQRFDGMAWPGYLASRTGKQRSTIKRMAQRFAGEGGTLEIVTDPRDSARALAAFEQVYSRSWKQPEPYPGFIPGLVEACARRGWLRLGIAWLGDQPIAAQLWIVCQRKADIYKLAYDEGFPRFSIGTLLTARMLEHVFTHDKVQEIDYLIGDDNYKRDWLDSRRERWGLIAYNPRTLPGAAGAATEAAKRVAKLLVQRLRRRSPKPSPHDGVHFAA